MASRAHTAGGPKGLPLALIAQAIAKLSRNDLEALTERLIDYLDEQDGDADTELNGDEQDACNAEDDFGGGSNVGTWGHPGCPISDPDLAVDDDRCDDDRDYLKPHRDFIRRTRCDHLGPRSSLPYRLRH
jgi:hypothetical protein